MLIFSFDQLFLSKPRDNVEDSIVDELRVVLLMSALFVHVLLACVLFIHYRKDYRCSWRTRQENSYQGPWAALAQPLHEALPDGQDKLRDGRKVVHLVRLERTYSSYTINDRLEGGGDTGACKFLFRLLDR